MSPKKSVIRQQQKISEVPVAPAGAPCSATPGKVPAGAACLIFFCNILCKSSGFANCHLQDVGAAQLLTAKQEVIVGDVGINLPLPGPVHLQQRMQVLYLQAYNSCRFGRSLTRSASAWVELPNVVV